MINFKNTTYAYDEWNRLEEVVKGIESTEIQYGLHGLRVKKDSPAEVTRYHYNAKGEVIAESGATNTIKAQYVRGPDRLLMKVDKTTNQDYYYLYNGHGDVVQMIDTAGNIVNHYQYDEWGNILDQQETVGNAFKYAGEMYDDETGLYYLRARYYDPQIGRFINKDTYEGVITNPLTLNLYSYVYNNPLMYTDPRGNIGIFQIDNLVKGLALTGGEAIVDLLKSPITLIRMGKAIATGDLSLVDLGKAIGASVTEPIAYLVENSYYV